jgi:hypothetical protein
MKLYVSQDGAQFYCSKAANHPGFDLETGEASEDSVVVSYPHPVRDFDMPAARKAREWFLKQCVAQGLTPERGVKIVFD